MKKKIENQKLNSVRALLALLLGIVVLLGIGMPASAATFHTATFLNERGTNVQCLTATTNKPGDSLLYGYLLDTYGAGGTTNVTAQTVTNTAALRQLPLWAKSDGSVCEGNVFASIVGTNAAFTNIITFRAYAVPRGPGYSKTTTAADSFSFTLTGNGTTPVSIKTNLTSGVFQGCGAIQVEVEYPTQGAGTNASTCFVKTLSLNGFQP